MAEDNAGPLARLRELADRNPATSQLADAVQGYASAKAKSVVTQSAKSLGHTVERLVGGGDSDDGSSLGTRIAKGAVVEGGKGIKDKAKGLVGKLPGMGGGSGGGSGGGGGGAGGKWPITIVEDIDVGVPVRAAYNQWSAFPDFGRFAKGVISVHEGDDETASRWNAKIFWSNRRWDATITEQIQDYRIAWETEGDKGTTKGAVTFHPLGENITRVLLVTEYRPVGFFERTGNLWRAQGRRLRLDLKHYRRHLMMMAQQETEELEGWRGEIRDSEVVVSHDEAMEREQEESRSESDEAEEEHDEEAGEAEEDEDFGEEEEPEDEEEPDEDGEEEEPEEELEYEEDEDEDDAQER
ncbi:SRPBCC family protein [Nocardiopsis lambiniae]|uniref:SRPBCC family protein n=1 Tax=Nocardiopsis lambiniae TaxID=3075539 RepID=A0ABU2M6L7_9ACTN|nr:SRPBCC family protein [Nocardiopsis sp. DSM 44743]MDT0328307.1 SRPBCC family protein [Nocardiopsis sp. DSM 44743]